MLEAVSDDEFFWEPVGGCWTAFGSASLTFDRELPGDATEATDWLFGSHEPLTNELINEQVHHGAEISLLRDLYRCRDSLAAR